MTNNYIIRIRYGGGGGGGRGEDIQSLRARLIRIETRMTNNTNIDDIYRMNTNIDDAYGINTNIDDLYGIISITVQGYLFGGLGAKPSSHVIPFIPRTNPVYPEKYSISTNNTIELWSYI